MGTIVKTVVGCLVFVVVLVAVTNALDGNPTRDPATSELSARGGSTALSTQTTPGGVTVLTTPPARAPASLDPIVDGKSDLRCDYLLGNDPVGGTATFVAGGDLSNTGNIGIRVRVTAKWQRLGSSPVTVSKHYRVHRGETRTINFSVAASSDDIDAHQSADGRCSAHSVIEGTFGSQG